MSYKDNYRIIDDNSTYLLSDEAKFFVEPKNSKHRQYEALRAYFVDGVPSSEAAIAFGYTPGAFHVLCHNFRKKSNHDFFIETKPGPKFATKKDTARFKVLELRKQNYSVPDIHMFLKNENINLGKSSIWNILDDEGFSRLPRRKDDEKPDLPRHTKMLYADVRRLSFEPRVIETKFGGLFLLLKILSELNTYKIPRELKWYGSKMIPTSNAFLSSLILKLIGKSRKSHIMDLLDDEGLALAGGFCVFPKTAYLAEYSNRITHEENLAFLRKWLKNLSAIDAIKGESINLDFQSLPYFGEDDVVEKHYVSMRSRSQNAILVFFAQDAESKIFCYSNADLRKGEENDEILKFVKFWKKQTGKNPPHLVFDSKLTTYENLRKLDDKNITFITIRRRSPSILKDVMNASPSAWRKITLNNVARKYRFPKVIDHKVGIKDYGTIRQIFIKDLGHDLPTILITNDEKTKVSELISRYALRMLIENSIAHCVKFFHTTALSSSVAMKIDFDVLLTIIGQASYHIFGKKLRGYEQSGGDVLFRKFIDTPAKIIIGQKEIEIRLNKRTSNPILLQSEMLNSTFELPWINTKKKFIITTK